MGRPQRVKAVVWCAAMIKSARVRVEHGYGIRRVSQRLILEGRGVASMQVLEGSNLGQQVLPKRGVQLGSADQLVKRRGPKGQQRHLHVTQTHQIRAPAHRTERFNNAFAIRHLWISLKRHGAA
jgi:hypothetical protein